jgi:hypothetical protein
MTWAALGGSTGSKKGKRFPGPLPRAALKARAAAEARNARRERRGMVNLSILKRIYAVK